MSKCAGLTANPNLKMPPRFGFGSDAFNRLKAASGKRPTCAAGCGTAVTAGAAVAAGVWVAGGASVGRTVVAVGSEAQAIANTSKNATRVGIDIQGFNFGNLNITRPPRMGTKYSYQLHSPNCEQVSSVSKKDFVFQ
jgi:hypothetical protein